MQNSVLDSYPVCRAAPCVSSDDAGHRICCPWWRVAPSSGFLFMAEQTAELWLLLSLLRPLLLPARVGEDLQEPSEDADSHHNVYRVPLKRIASGTPDRQGECQEFPYFPSCEVDMGSCFPQSQPSV